MQENKEKLKKIIEEEVFIRASEGKISNRRGGFHETGWIFDFRRVLMQAEVLSIVSEIFWEKFEKKYPFQLGSLEVAGIPLVMGLMHHIYSKEGKRDVNAFFIRKSRKKDGLLKMIEGVVQENKEIILVDDIINSGKSFIRMVTVLKELGFKINTVWSLLSFRDAEFYIYFEERGIKVEFVYMLDDFTKTLGTKNRASFKTPKIADYSFNTQWKFSSPNPNLQYVVNKSNPVLDEDRIYFGSDSGYMWALNQKDGSVAWKFKVGMHARGKSIFSNPVLYKELLIFGSYDGNLYGLNKNTGKKVWINFDADWIGSSPCISPELGLGFIGLEFGLFRKKGGIMAFDLKTGKRVWKDESMAFTHSSPFYIKEKKQVVIGGNDGIAKLYNAKTGKKIWEFKTGEITTKEGDSGFSKIDIKESFAYYPKKGYIIFGNIAGFLFIINAKDGSLVHKYEAGFGFYSTPLIYNDRVYASSVDKKLYCIDLITLKEVWQWKSGARIFASPTEINGKIYIGSNTGRMSEIDPQTGMEIGFVTVPERITGQMIYNKKTKRFFLPTFANEIYCIEKKLIDHK
jgi:outer membrane protein assembly factor BamB/adenine/guanine phosphoribosyltransferase-like PRPP-binding protein